MYIFGYFEIPNGTRSIGCCQVNRIKTNIIVTLIELFLFLLNKLLTTTNLEKL